MCTPQEKAKKTREINQLLEHYSWHHSSWMRQGSPEFYRSLGKVLSRTYIDRLGQQITTLRKERERMDEHP